MIIADVPTPAQPAPTLSTVTPQKPKTLGEEQVRTKAHREASHKQFTTSECLNLVSIDLLKLMKLSGERMKGLNKESSPVAQKDLTVATCSNKGKPICCLIIIVIVHIKLAFFLLKNALFSASDSADNCCV